MMPMLQAIGLQTQQYKNLVKGKKMRLTGSNSSISPTLSGTGTYKFKIAANGIVAKNSTYGNITSGLNTGSMTNIFSGDYDDQSYNIDMGSVSFLGNTYSQLYVSGNGGFSFGSANDARNGGDNDPVTDNGDPCIYMVNNDANLQEVWATSFDGGTTFAYKIMGNTNYDNGGINYEYDIYLYSNGTVDVFVVQEPTDWDAYNDGLGNVQWGVTNGTNWVDGYTNHFSSFGAASSGLRITGGLRLGGTPAPSKTLTWNGIYYVPLPVGQLQTIELLYSNWDGSTIYVTIFGTGIVSGDFDTGLSGTIDGLTGSGMNTTVQFTATPQAAGKTYQLKFGSSFGAGDYLISDPYTISS